jgi:hypothetical protein
MLRLAIPHLQTAAISPISAILAGFSLRSKSSGSYGKYCKATYVESDRPLRTDHVCHRPTRPSQTAGEDPVTNSTQAYRTPVLSSDGQPVRNSREDFAVEVNGLRKLGLHGLRDQCHQA